MFLGPVYSNIKLGCVRQNKHERFLDKIAKFLAKAYAKKIMQSGSSPDCSKMPSAINAVYDFSQQAVGGVGKVAWVCFAACLAHGNK